MPVRPKRRPTTLRLLPGGSPRLRLGSLEVVAAPEGESPFPVEARVCEEDTFLVLSAPAEIREPLEHPVRIFTALWQARPYPPGTVLVQRGRPTRLLAVVYDLEAEPICREEWVAAALAELLTRAREKRLRSLALPLLGTRGRLPAARFGALLKDALARGAPAGLARLWLVAPDEQSEEILRALGP